jgi:hypothetical protein
VTGPYTSEFFTRWRDRSRSSADAILPPIIAALGAESLVDVGAGLGTWTAAARAAGVADVLALDGAWVDTDLLEISADQFRTVDLREPIRVDRRFDLAIAMEVAEHLPPERSAGFVADLVTLAPVVLFSAAIPGQGGNNHINERWPEFWADLFASHGYRCLDAVRWRHWTDERVEYWYAQNAYIYAAEGAVVPLPAAVDVPMAVVHPAVLRLRADPRSASVASAMQTLAWHGLANARHAKRRLGEASASWRFAKRRREAGDPSARRVEP